jgi:class 3 adenylate cyclase
VGETRKLAAILVADVVGYSRLAAADEDRTLARLRGLRSDLIDPAIAAHHGRIIKRTGEGSIIEFRSVVDAVRCGIEVAACCTSRRWATRCEATRHAKFCGSVSGVARPPRHTVAAQALLSQLRPFRRYSRVFFG